MTVGEKIKYYRNIRGISQEMLGNLSGINPATIKKYEYGIRNPKPDRSTFRVYASDGTCTDGKRCSYIV